MVGVATAADARTIIIAGHRIRVRGPHRLASGITIVPSVPKIDLDLIAKSTKKIHEYSADMYG